MLALEQFAEKWPFSAGRVVWLLQTPPPPSLG